MKMNRGQKGTGRSETQDRRGLEVFHLHAVVELTCDPSAARDARSFVLEVLAELDAGVCSEDAELLMSEVATNTVKYGRCRSTFVSAWVSDGVVRFEVTDANVEPPVRRNPTPGEFGGRGLRLLDQLASRWGYRLAPHGKTVFFELQMEVTP